MTFKHFFLPSLGFCCVLTFSDPLMASKIKLQHGASVYVDQKTFNPLPPSLSLSQDKLKQATFFSTQKGLNLEIKTLNERIQSLNTVIRQTNNELDRLRDDNGRKDQKIALYESELQQVRNEFNERRKEYQEKLKELANNTTANITSKFLESKEEQIDSLVEENENLKQICKAMLQEKKELTQQVNQKEKKIQYLYKRAEEEILKAKNKNKATIKLLQQQIQELLDELNAMERYIQDIEGGSVDNEILDDTLSERDDSQGENFVRKRQKTIVDMSDVSNLQDKLNYPKTPRHREDSVGLLRRFSTHTLLGPLSKADEDNGSDVSEEDADPLFDLLADDGGDGSPTDPIKNVQEDTPNEEDTRQKATIVVLSVVLCLSMLKNIHYYIRCSKTTSPRKNTLTHTATGVFKGEKPKYIEIVIPT